MIVRYSSDRAGGQEEPSPTPVGGDCSAPTADRQPAAWPAPTHPSSGRAPDSAMPGRHAMAHRNPQRTPPPARRAAPRQARTQPVGARRTRAGRALDARVWADFFLLRTPRGRSRVGSLEAIAEGIALGHLCVFSPGFAAPIQVAPREAADSSIAPDGARRGAEEVAALLPRGARAADAWDGRPPSGASWVYKSGHCWAAAARAVVLFCQHSAKGLP